MHRFTVCWVLSALARGNDRCSCAAQTPCFPFISHAVNATPPFCDLITSFQQHMECCCYTMSRLLTFSRGSLIGHGKLYRKKEKRKKNKEWRSWDGPSLSILMSCNISLSRCEMKPFLPFFLRDSPLLLLCGGGGRGGVKVVFNDFHPREFQHMIILPKYLRQNLDELLFFVQYTVIWLYCTCIIQYKTYSTQDSVIEKTFLMFKPKYHQK